MVKVVGGLEYLMDINFVNKEGQVQTYEVTVYLRPWEQYSEVKDIKKLPA